MHWLITPKVLIPRPAKAVSQAQTKCRYLTCLMAQKGTPPVSLIALKHSPTWQMYWPLKPCQQLNLLIELAVLAETQVSYARALLHWCLLQRSCLQKILT